MNPPRRNRHARLLALEFPPERAQWCLVAVCRLLEAPFDPALIERRIAPRCSLATLAQSLEALGLRVRLEPGARFRPRPRDLPCLTLRRIKKPEEEPELVLAVRADGDTVTCFAAGAERPEQITVDEWSRRFEPIALVVERSPAPLEDTGEDAPGQRFGFRWFVPELLRHRGIWRDVLLASFAIQLLALATPLLTQVIIDKVLIHHTVNTLMVVASGMAMFVLFGAAMSWARQHLVLHTGNRIDAVLGARVFRHLLALPPRYFEHRSTGTLVARVQGVDTIREFISGAAVTLLLDVPFLFIFLAVMFYYSALLTAVVAATLTLIALLSLTVTPLLRRRLDEQFRRGARNQAFVTEHLSGIETVKSLQMEPQIERRWGDYLAAYLGASFRTRSLANAYNVGATTLEQAQTVAILSLGAWLVMSGTGFTVGMLVAFQMFASRLAQPVLRLVALWQQLQQASVAVRRLGDIMDAPPEPQALRPRRRGAGPGAIAVRAMSFRYGPDLPYLYRDLDLRIAPGSCVLLLGPSGSGKSTLAKLLLGFYRPTEGAILVDGLDTRHLAANELRHYFGVVPQETVLFSGTLYDNLLAARPRASFEQIVQACRMAEIHATIERLPRGYQTVVGEHGAGLSGGQRQRIAIARALLKQPRVLIFDEATSSLDAPTAESFARTVNRLRGKVTILFISHQPPRGLQADEAVILGTRRKPPSTPAVSNRPTENSSTTRPSKA